MTTTDLAICADIEAAGCTPLTEREAKALDKKIRVASAKVSSSREELIELLDQAAQGQIHIALGLPSWTAWFSETVEIRPIDVADRRELVRMMASKGMSTRAAAKVLQISQSTANRDLDGELFDSDTVTGLDGAQRPRSKPIKDDEPEPLDVDEAPLEDEPEPLRPVSEDFQDEMWNLINTVQAFKDMLEDDRLFVTRTRNSLTKKHLNDLQDAIKELNGIVDFLMG